MKDLLSELKNRNYDTLSSSEFESLIFIFLRERGEIKRQIFVPERGDGKSGRVDFLFKYNGRKIGIEVDRKSPRVKSIFKLKILDVDERYVILKSPFTLIQV